MNRLARETVVNCLNDEIVELSVLVPGWQADELTAAAHARGLTAGQMVRRLIREFCRHVRDTDQWQTPVASNS